MADINATNLTPETLSTLDGTENIVAFDTAEGKKIPLSVLGDYVVQKLTQTLLGQTQSVADAFGMTYNLGIATDIPNNADLNTYTNAGTFKTGGNATAATLSNCPVTGITFKMTVEKIYSGNGIIQSLVAFNNPPKHFERRGLYSSSTWSFSEWLQVPTRAEMDAATNKMSGLTGIFNTDLALSGSSTQQYNVPNSSQHLVILQAASRTAHGIYLVSTTSSGVMQLTEVIKGENITVSAPSANTLEIVNAYTNGCYVTDICLRGSAITKVTESSS